MLVVQKHTAILTPAWWRHQMETFYVSLTLDKPVIWDAIALIMTSL